MEQGASVLVAAITLFACFLQKDQPYLIYMVLALAPAIAAIWFALWKDEEGKIPKFWFYTRALAWVFLLAAPAVPLITTMSGG